MDASIADPPERRGPSQASDLVAVTAVGQDRPGIVARVTDALYRLGCNLEETTMARLRDQFAMLLIVRPGEQGPEAVRAELERAAGELGLTLACRRLDHAAPSAGAAGAPHILRLYGADRPGIVHGVTALLAERGCNITDLNTRTFPGGSGQVYVMLLEVDLPSADTAAALEPELARLRRELGVEITFDALERETL